MQLDGKQGRVKGTHLDSRRVQITRTTREAQRDVMANLREPFFFFFFVKCIQKGSTERERRRKKVETPSHGTVSV